VWSLTSGESSLVPTGFVASEPVWKETNLSSCWQSTTDSPVILFYLSHYAEYAIPDSGLELVHP
jgi:hypothetical protein